LGGGEKRVKGNWGYRSHTRGGKETFKTEGGEAHWKLWRGGNNKKGKKTVSFGKVVKKGEESVSISKRGPGERVGRGENGGDRKENVGTGSWEIILPAPGTPEKI